MILKRIFAFKGTLSDINISVGLLRNSLETYTASPYTFSVVLFLDALYTHILYYKKTRLLDFTNAVFPT